MTNRCEPPLQRNFHGTIGPKLVNGSGDINRALSNGQRNKKIILLNVFRQIYKRLIECIVFTSRGRNIVTYKIHTSRYQMQYTITC